MGEFLPQRTFRDCVDTLFRVGEGSSSQLDLLLTAVEPGGASPGYEVFSLLFRGPANRYLPQATYALRNERLGEIAIFLVPIAKDAHGYIYEAVFNREIGPEPPGPTSSTCSAPTA